MRICVAQARVRAAALDENFSFMRKAVIEAQQAQADIIVFPEMSLPGYFLGDAWERPSFLRRCEDLTQQIAALSTQTAILFGSVGIDWNARNEDGRVRKFNAAFLAQNGSIVENPGIGLPFWPKTLLPNYREFDDSRHFFDLRKLALERGESLESLTSLAPLKLTDGRQITLGIGLCEDAWDDDYSSKPYALMLKKTSHPDLLVNLSCSPFTLGKHQKRLSLFSRLAKTTGCPVVYVNAVGSQNVGKTIFTFDGQSGIYKDDVFIPVGNPFVAATQVIDISAPAVSKALTTEQSRFEEIHAALEFGLGFVREEWNLEKVVIGVSGGIDSALSATLHARVFGSENVYCVNMPSKFNSPLTISAAKALANNLNCKYASLGIEDSLALTHNQLAEARNQGLPIPSNTPSLVFENIQARDRGARIIAGVASSLSAVFPCNANKSEVTVGYSTLYGDHAGYLSPLADLWKSDVYGLAQHYNQNVFGTEIIPKSSLTVVPSAELSAAQDVTQGKGDPLVYPYHDALFRLWIESWNRHDCESLLQAWDNNTLSALLGPEAALLMSQMFQSRDAFELDLRKWWKAYTGMGAFKRVQAPPILALTRRAFGFDHREAVGLARM